MPLAAAANGAATIIGNSRQNPGNLGCWGLEVFGGGGLTSITANQQLGMVAEEPRRAPRPYRSICLRLEALDKHGQLPSMPDTQTLFRNNKLRHGLFRPTGIFQFDERVNVSFLDLGNKTFEIMPKRTAS